MHKDAGIPSYRQLGANIGVSHAHLGRILTGQQVPSRHLLIMLGLELTANDYAIGRMVAEYDRTYPRRRVNYLDLDQATRDRLARIAQVVRKENPGP